MIQAEVYLWGTRIGYVVQENYNSIARFNYDEKFLKSGIEIAPIMMPLANRVYSFPNLSVETFKGLPGLLADSLPDKFGTKLIERYLSDSGRDISTFSSIEKLCYVGQRGMGALEYVPANKDIDISNMTVDIDALTKLASDILTERKKLRIDRNESVMSQLIKVGTSAGGARAKAVIAWNEETDDIMSGQIEAGKGYGYWLLKFDGIENNKDKGEKADDPEYTRIEYAYYMMAKDAGIDMSECRLYQENGRHHFMTKRFDRDEITGNKLHMQSLGAIAHYDFNEPGAHSYEQATHIMYQLGLKQQEIEKLYRRMVFNVIARNQDDHVKNISFLMDRQGRWSLSPAYDVTYAYDRSNLWLARHQMSINGKTENYNLDDILMSGKQMNISRAKALNIIEEVESSVSHWKKFSEQAKIREEVFQEIKSNHVMLLEN
ncbi:MAG TPA: toxin HipA [Lachnospiraceae bacterium]|nr:toxin HipA [Lachnospiraceae bacterium]